MSEDRNEDYAPDGGNPPVAPEPAPEPAPRRPRERLGNEIDVAAIQASKQRSDADLDVQAHRPVWEEDDAPAGSTASSLLVYERGKAVRVSGPTHYQHLQDGRVVAGYAGGTHFTEPGDNDGPDKISRVVATYEG